MAGGSTTFRCNRCPLTIEVGQVTLWDGDRGVYFHQLQLDCAGCGTLHRITEENGECRVTALPGPVREMRAVTVRMDSGEEIEVPEMPELDWGPVGLHPNGIADRSGLACSHCGLVGRVGWPVTVRRPGDPPRDADAGPRCSVCGGPAECIAISDSV